MSHEKWFDVVRLILDLKQGCRPTRIPIIDAEGETVGRLEPLGLAHLEYPELVRQFVRWRNQNLSGYLDQRPVTESGTTRWLVDVVTDPSRIAFLIFAGEKLIGRCGNLEMRPWELMTDGLVRGERGGGTNFIHYATIAQVVWSFRVLGMATILAKVLSTNDAAIENCRRLGFDLQPLRSCPVYLKSLPAGNVLEESGLPSELMPDVTLNYYQMNQSACQKLVEQSPGFMALDAEIRAAAMCSAAMADRPSRSS